MLGGLYGDLPPPSSTSAAAEDDRAATSASAVWSSSAKMAPATLRKPLAPPSSLLKPRVQSKPSSFAPNPSTHVGNHAVRDEAEKIQSLQPALVAITTSVVEEYDPGRPNSYEDYRREKKRRAVEAEVKRELDRKRREEEERERERERERREREEAEAEAEAAREVEARAALNITGEEAWRRRAALGGAPPRSPSPPQVAEGEGFSIGKSKSVGLGVGAGGQMTAAQRMMAKMGWKEGQGLGKQEQGITTPLMAKKTDRRAGVIVNASEAKPEGKKPKSVNFNGPPTRVLLLRNMVGPGEVDDELEEEVGSECAKYGLVTRVLIFEITEPNFPAEEAVRIFIQFERSEWTTKALIDLDGRYFGGRIVKATFYDEERFSRNELAPMPGDIPGFF